MEIELKRDEFEKWLKKHKYVTYDNYCYSCPIAKYLQEQYKTIDISVGMRSIWYKTKKTKSPDWVEKFVGLWAVGTGDKALKLLKEIK